MDLNVVAADTETRSTVEVQEANNQDGECSY